MFAKRIKTLQPSHTMTLDTKAKMLKSRGIAVINLTAGEPDFETPNHIKTAAKEAIEHGFTRYTAAQGMMDLRTAIAEKFRKDNNISYNPSQIIVGTGAKQILYSIFHVLCDSGTEVIIPVPTWTTFIEQVKLAGGKPVLVKLSSPFKLTEKDVAKAITKKTKMLVLNSPANPTGAMLDLAELKKIADLAIKQNLWIISDEIYEKLIYTGQHISIASLNDTIKKRTITVNGVSKAYAMTGWRLGFAGGPQKVIDAMSALQGQMTSNASSISQKAALAAVTYSQLSVSKMLKEFARRREYLISELSDIKQISFTAPEGAFYFFIAIEKLLNKTFPTSTKWCEALLEKEQVAVVPGEAFFYPGYFRLSCSASMDELKEAIKRIKRFIETY